MVQSALGLDYKICKLKENRRREKACVPKPCARGPASEPGGASFDQWKGLCLDQASMDPLVSSWTGQLHAGAFAPWLRWAPLGSGKKREHVCSPLRGPSLSPFTRRPSSCGNRVKVSRFKDLRPLCVSSRGPRLAQVPSENVPKWDE